MLYDVLVQVYTLYQGQDSVCTYYTKPTKLWSTYDTNKENTDPPNQFERSAKFLMGLNESYTTIRGVLMAQKPTPKHGELCPIIKQEEQQRSHSAPTTEVSTALVAKNQGLYRPPKPEIRERPFCTHCKRPGHVSENCYQIHGYPEKSNNYNNGNTQYQRRPSRPYNQNSNNIRRDNRSTTFNRGYNGNRTNSRAYNTYAEESLDSQKEDWYEYEQHQTENPQCEEDQPTESWANNSVSQDLGTLY